MRHWPRFGLHGDTRPAPPQARVTTVVIGLSALVNCESDHAAQFLVRRALQSKGVPIGPWGTSTVERGILRWYDRWSDDSRVIEWIDDEPVKEKKS